MRNAGHFGRPATDYQAFEYAGSADQALAQLDEVRTVDRGGPGSRPDGLREPCGPAERPWAAAPMAALVLHINRELIHHGAEVALLRDLYAPGRLNRAGGQETSAGGVVAEPALGLAAEVAGGDQVLEQRRRAKPGSRNSR